MKAETQILNGYWGLLNSLSPKLKLKLIEKLSKSIDIDSFVTDDRFEESFGAWAGSDDADKIIEEIRNSRNFNRKIESF